MLWRFRITLVSSFWVSSAGLSRPMYCPEISDYDVLGVGSYVFYCSNFYGTFYYCDSIFEELTSVSSFKFFRDEFCLLDWRGMLSKTSDYI